MIFQKPVVQLTGKPSERNRYHSDFVLGSLTSITLFHDYICPWCYVVTFQAKQLTEEYGVTFDWRGAELYPPGMVVPPPSKPDPNAPPPPPSRFERFLQTEGVTLPQPKPPFRRSHNALLGAEWALMELGQEAFERYNQEVYTAYWEQQEDISKPEVLRAIAERVGLDGEALTQSVVAKRYEENIIPFDEEAHALGIRNVPTFIFMTSERLAEANYTDLARATERFLIRSERYRGK